MTFGGLFVCLMGTAGDSYARTQAFVILGAAGIEVLLICTSLLFHSCHFWHAVKRLSVWLPLNTVF